MTSSSESGTNRGVRIRFEAMAWIAAIATVVALVNSASHLIEAQRRGAPLAPWEPFVWEFSSIAVIIGLSPLVGLAIERLPPRRDNVPPFVLGHLLLTVPFSLVHVAGMALLRQAVYLLLGQSYELSHGDLPLVLLYEWNKDALTYAAIAATFGYFRWRADQAVQRTPAARDRIEIRDGASAFFLSPAEIAWVEAAGNYVEFHAAARTHLVRGTLAAWETKLAPLGFVRAHRSRIVNRARIRALKPTPAGDVVITLDDGREIAGSRRCRADLED